MDKKTILVVDDSHMMRMAMGHLLTMEGYLVVQAAQGEAALEVLAAQDVDLVLTDLNMPVLDGLGLVRAMRADPRLAGVPIIMASGEDGEAVRAESRRAGANFWLDKPCDAETLTGLVSWALELRAGLPGAGAAGTSPQAAEA
ncbi:MAG: response regulator [Desulfovibrionaceae bacterium]